MRLSLKERGEIAIQLRKYFLEKEDSARLESIEDPALQPHEKATGSFAFEFFMDRFRERLNKRLVDNVVYSIGWSRATLELNEETRKKARVVRMATELCFSTLEGDDEFAIVASEMKAEYFDCPIEKESLALFLSEVIYELVRETVRNELKN